LKTCSVLRRSSKKKYDFPIACFGHAVTANIHVNIMVDYEEPRRPDARTLHWMNYFVRFWPGAAPSGRTWDWAGEEAMVASGRIEKKFETSTARSGCPGPAWDTESGEVS